MRRGFTFVELAVALVAVGLMVVFGVQAFSGSSSSDCYAKTEAQLKTIDTALQHFVATHARLPKPADMGLGSNQPAYGHEAQGSITDPLDFGYGTDVPSGMTNTGGVLIGALPHIALGLENSYASDCWGDKFTYAVTNALTSGNTSNGYMGNTAGAITLNSNTLAAPHTLSTALSYAVISHGADKYGATAVSANNRTPANCNGSTVLKIDRENCNSDAVFFNSTRNTGEVEENFFDDVVVYSTKIRSTEPCPGQPVNWESCTGSSAEIAHGSSATVTNMATGYTGSVSVFCNDGRLSQSSPVCTPDGGEPAGSVYKVCQAYYMEMSPPLYHNSCDCSDALTACQSGNATMTSTGGDTSGCPGPGVTLSEMRVDCYEEYSCTCN